MMAADLQGILTAHLTRWPRTAAIGVFDADSTLAVAGQELTGFEFASVTKTLTAYCCLIAVEEQIVSLDDPLGHEGSTLRHLLSHASGISGPGEVLAPPGHRRIYSNHNFDLIGGYLEAASQMPFADYLRDGILNPLGMDSTHFRGSPASGCRGPLVDLVRWGQELLAPTLVESSSLRSAVTPAFGGIAGVLPGFGTQRHNDWGLGFEIKGDKRPHWTGALNSPATFGHFGRSGSFLWVDPALGVGCCSLSSEDFGPWAETAWPATSDAVIRFLRDQ